MKRIVTAVLTALVVLSLTACGSDVAGKEKTAIRIAGLKGPTSIGMLKLVEDCKEGKTEGTYEFSAMGSADEATPLFMKDEIDIVSVPANLASVLYNNSEGNMQILAINTLGVLYIVENGNTIQTVSDLEGMTIYGSGKGSTPEYALRYILTQNGIDPDNDLTIEWKNEHTEVVSALAANAGAVGLLPQPFVTAAQTQIEDLRIAVDLTKEWEKIEEGTTMITGVLAVKKDFAEQHRDELNVFLKEYEESVNYTNEEIDKTAELCEKYDIIKAAVAKKAIPYCNIVCITGTEMEKPMDEYLKVLFDANPKSIGGKLPEKDFYYE